MGVAYVPFATPSSMILRGSSASLSNGIGSILGIPAHFRRRRRSLSSQSYEPIRLVPLVSMDPSSVLLTGRVAVVTGGGSGIGRGIARGLAAFGASVAIWERDADSSASAAAEVGGLGLTTDVRQSVEVDEALARTTAELGPVSILVNNAGGVFSSPILETSENGWDVLYRAKLKNEMICN